MWKGEMSAVRKFIALLVLGSLATALVIFTSRDRQLLPRDEHGSPEGAARQSRILHMASEKWQTFSHIEGSVDNLTNGQPAATAATASKGLDHPISSSLFQDSGGMGHLSITKSPKQGAANWSWDMVISAESVSHKVNTSADQKLIQLCTTPRKNILFLKTHKTGSSTVQNIIYRYGDKNDLIFAMPMYDVYMGTPSLFQSKFAKKSPTGKYNILANHARYNRPEMDKIMFEDTAYITVLRHPSMQFESMYTYYGFDHLFRVTLSAFANNPLKYYVRQGPHPMHSSLNPTLYDLGMRKENLDDFNAIERKISSLDSEFDIVLISEYILESLVLLKDLMCWEFSDVTYFSANARTKSELHELSERTRSQLYKWNHGDALLYEHFNRTLWTKVDAYGRGRMAMDVKMLEKMNESLKEKCLGGTKKEKFMKTMISRYILKEGASDNDECIRMIRPAPKYLATLKKKQAKMFTQT